MVSIARMASRRLRPTCAEIIDTTSSIGVVSSLRTSTPHLNPVGRKPANDSNEVSGGRTGDDGTAFDAESVIAAGRHTGLLWAVKVAKAGEHQVVGDVRVEPENTGTVNDRANNLVQPTCLCRRCS